MDINVSCELCGGYIEVVKEYSERGDIIITVKPCESCVQEKLDWLTCLEQAGVDNWQGIDYAYKIQEEMINVG
jgi:hypothetical protein